MTDNDLASLPAPTFADGDGAIARRAQMMDQLPSTPGTQRAPFAPTAVAPPEWWAEARIPLDDAASPAS